MVIINKLVFTETDDRLKYLQYDVISKKVLSTISYYYTSIYKVGLGEVW